MRKLKITMPGAGSGFVLSIAKELLIDPVFADAEFVLMDPDQERLDVALGAVKEIVQNSPNHIRVRATTDRTDAIEGADYVITSCEKNRYPNWVKDLRIPQKYGVEQVKGENGGPGGLIHGIRNICMFRDFADDIEKYAPQVTYYGVSAFDSPDAYYMLFTDESGNRCVYYFEATERALKVLRFYNSKTVVTKVRY